MTINRNLFLIFIAGIAAVACGTSSDLAPGGVNGESGPILTHRTELEHAMDMYLMAVLASDVDAVQAALSPSAHTMLKLRLSSSTRSWSDFVSAERRKVVRALRGENLGTGFSVRRIHDLGDAFVVSGALSGKLLPKTFRIERVAGELFFAGPGGVAPDMESNSFDETITVELGGTREFGAIARALGTDSYRIDNNTSTAHSMKCTGYSFSNIPANQTTYKTCDNSCGYWAGTQFWDGTTSIGYCDYETFGADVVINGSLANCVDPC